MSIKLYILFPRPVLAIFDANVLRTKAQEKQLILHQQLHNHGPSDCCVKVSCQSDEDIDNAALDKLLAEISLGAEVVLVRYGLVFIVSSGFLLHQ